MCEAGCHADLLTDKGSHARGHFSQVVEGVGSLS
jgi:hypothetical protein